MEMKRIYYKEIMEEISFLFKIYNIRKLAEESAYTYVKSDWQNVRLKDNNLDIETLVDKFKLIYWAMIGVQVEIGYLLITNESYEKQQGMLNYMLFFHHYSLCIECIYRVWERFSGVISYILTKKSKTKKIYYTQAINMPRNGIITEELISELKTHVSKWETIAKLRNKYSHEYSRLIEGMSTIVTPSEIISPYDNQQILKIKEIRENLREKIDLIKQHFNYLEKVNDTMKKVLEETRY